MVQLLWKIVWRFLKRLKIELPHAPAIPPLAIQQKEVKSGLCRDLYTPMFTVALLTVAKVWKSPSVHKWISG